MPTMLLILLLGLLLRPDQAGAQSPYYKGKVINVIVGTTAGDLYTLDVRSGKPIWQYQTGSSIISSPSVAENKLIIGSKDGILYCFGEKNIS